MSKSALLTLRSPASALGACVPLQQQQQQQQQQQHQQHSAVDSTTSTTATAAATTATVTATRSTTGTTTAGTTTSTRIRRAAATAAALVAANVSAVVVVAEWPPSHQQQQQQQQHQQLLSYLSNATPQLPAPAAAAAASSSSSPSAPPFSSSLSLVAAHRQVTFGASLPTLTSSSSAPGSEDEGGGHDEGLGGVIASAVGKCCRHITESLGNVGQRRSAFRRSISSTARAIGFGVLDYSDDDDDDEDDEGDLHHSGGRNDDDDTLIKHINNSSSSSSNNNPFAVAASMDNRPSSENIVEQLVRRHFTTHGSTYPGELPFSAMLTGTTGGGGSGGVGFASPSGTIGNASSSSLSSPSSSALSSICASGCGGNGECLSGVCYCKVEFAGGTCQEPNLSFYIAFSTIFYTICAISFVQLVICIRCEFQRHSPASVVVGSRLARALRLTTQKALYGLICVATALRGFYFSSPDNAELKWAKSLLSAYYPLLLTGSSLIVCLWAELFHVRDARLDPPGFLTKSLLGFIVFNFVIYALLFLEMISSQYAGYREAERLLLFRVFNGSFAVLMVIVVVVFLVYGVKVFVKIRGAFLTALGPHAEASHVPDRSQQHQSRVGLVTYALLTLVTALFIISDMTGPLWKHRLALVSRNAYEVSFRLIEIGLALWFPCVLWNCVQPQQLWILNPKRLLIRKPAQSRHSAFEDSSARLTNDLGSVERLGPPECFICYDSERRDAGPLIRPCNCRGDVSVVHHDCLKTWLVESAASSQCSRCKVCNEEYELERGEVWLPSGLSTMNWVQTCCVVALMGCSATAAILVVKLYTHIALRSLSVGLAVLVQYVCLRVLGVGVLAAYKRARFSAVRIISRKLTHGREASAALMAAAKEGPHSVAAAVKHELAAVHQNQKLLQQQQAQQQQSSSSAANTSM